MSYTEEDTCMSYEEEDTHRRQDAMIYTVVRHSTLYLDLLS
jgi:hypothetical protein